MNIPERLKERYTWFKLHSVSEVSTGAAFEIISSDKNGLLSEITAKIHALAGNVTNFQSWIEYDGKCHITMQIDNQCDHDQIIRSLKNIPEVESVSTTTTNIKTWGKRIIIIGGGAQVASVASGAIAEADRHNIRGETISVDTIAVVGEQEIADSISAVGKLQRVGMLILAGSLMGGKITAAVNNLRSEYGIPVIALNMAGSVTKACDLVVTDPIEAGVMSVMLISHIGKFNLLKVHGKKY
jgi:energy-converting hydrogenase B subunit Q